MTELVGYMALFIAVAVFFVFIQLVAGRFIRPVKPDPEKLTIYECGEPTIGSSWIQFDLRFYVVALLFIIFDVEVAFFFPWAVVFGKGNQLRDIGSPDRAIAAAEARQDPKETAKSKSEIERQKDLAAAYKSVVDDKFAELGVSNADWPKIVAQPPGDASQMSGATVRKIGEIGDGIVLTAMIDIAVFFAVLMVGFFYVWR